MGLKDVTTEALSTILEYTKQSAEFVKEQAPLIAQEIIKYTICSSIVYLLLSLLFGFLAIQLLKFGNRELKKDDYSFNGIGSYIAVIIILIFSFVGTIVHTEQLIKAVAAPRVLIIEKLQQKIR